MFKHAKRLLKKEPAKPPQESASRPISPPPGSRPTEQAGPSIVVPPTEAAIAAVNANKGYSGSVLASKLQEQQLISPRIPAAPPRPSPSETSIEPRYSASSVLAEPSITPLQAASETAPPDQSHRQSAPGSRSTLRADLTTAFASSHHVEESGASYTSSTGSAGRPRGHSPNAKDHKAALHAANERLQKALQHGAKHPAASAAAAPQTSAQSLSSVGGTAAPSSQG